MKEFNELLYQLLNRLDAIAAEHREVEDTAVREAMAEAILNGFCRKQDDDRLPLKFAMHSLKGNIDVMVALAYYVGNAGMIAGLDTFHQRLAAFQNPKILSGYGHDFGYYFGIWNAKDFDENGNRLDGRDI